MNKSHNMNINTDEKTRLTPAAFSRKILARIFVLFSRKIPLLRTTDRAAKMHRTLENTDFIGSNAHPTSVHLEGLEPYFLARKTHHP